MAANSLASDDRFLETKNKGEEKIINYDASGVVEVKERFNKHKTMDGRDKENIYYVISLKRYFMQPQLNLKTSDVF